MVNTKRELVTPEKAQGWLATQVRNRQVNKERVSVYANDMTAGRWMDNNDAICISNDGHLLNGQHRLMAVIKSGSSVWMDVKYGVSSEAIIDRGQPRATYQSLYMRGVIPDDLCAKKLFAR